MSTRSSREVPGPQDSGDQDLLRQTSDAQANDAMSAEVYAERLKAADERVKRSDERVKAADAELLSATDDVVLSQGALDNVDERLEKLRLTAPGRYSDKDKDFLGRMSRLPKEMDEQVLMVSRETLGLKHLT